MELAGAGRGSGLPLGMSDTARAFRQLFEYAPVGLCLVDLDGHVFTANAAMAQLLGVDEEQLRGRTITDITHPDDLAPMLELFEELRAGRRLAYSVERRFRRADGQPRWVHVSVVLVHGPDEEPLFAIALVVDAEERKRRERALTEARGIAHDFANLLTVIAGYTEAILASAPDTDPHRPHLEQIHLAAERATALVRRLLEGTTDAKPSAPQALDVNHVILGLKDVAKQLVGSGIEIVTRLSPSRPVAFAEREGLERAVANIAANARDAMPGGGTLTIATGERDGMTEISLSDTGVGMDPIVRDHVFERGFTTKPAGKGSGIGLANASEFVSHAGGSIEVESEPGEGSTFTIRLPRAKPGSYVIP